MSVRLDHEDGSFDRFVKSDRSKYRAECLCLFYFGEIGTPEQLDKPSGYIVTSVLESIQELDRIE